MLPMDFRESEQMEWAQPIVVAPKKDETLCICVSYSKLSVVTTWDLYLIPRMDKRIDSLENATVFSTLDPNSRY